jgi:hypothetical protein
MMLTSLRAGAVLTGDDAGNATQLSVQLASSIKLPAIQIFNAPHAQLSAKRVVSTIVSLISIHVGASQRLRYQSKSEDCGKWIYTLVDHL